MATFAPPGRREHRNLKVTVASPEECEAYIRDNGVECIDAVFSDPMGLWHHCTFMPAMCTAEDLANGLPFDGSSIRLFRSINESDMMMAPDLTTCYIDPFAARKTLHVVCSIKEPEAAEGYDRDPRTIALKAENYLRSTGIADTAYFGPEAEFFVFDEVKFGAGPNWASYKCDGEEGYWRTSETTGTGHRVPTKNWYFPVSPIDSMHDLRTEMLLTMNDVGLPAEKHHHEVATCQGELGFTFRPLIECADALMTYKHCIKNVAKEHGKVATFMPKPIPGDNGSGMHVHQSLWKDGRPIFFDDAGTYAKMSAQMRHYIGGLLKHAPAVLAFTNPGANSYRRLVPGFEAPTYLVYSASNRSAAVRIPMYHPNNPKAKRLEFRCPDPSCCPYLAFAAMLMAGLDGIQNSTEPPAPVDADLYDLPEEAQRALTETPGSLEEVCNALERDHAFLTKGGVFTEEFIADYIKFKRAEVARINKVPHPLDFETYFHC